MYLVRNFSSSDPDHHVRAAALVAIERLSRQHGGRIRWADIQRGFNVGGERIYFATRAQGIFKPKQMSAALSIRTVIPRSGREAWYRDQGLGGRNSDPETGLLRYDLARGGPDESSNRSLQAAMKRRAPIIYFAGFAPSELSRFFPYGSRNSAKTKCSWQPPTVSFRWRTLSRGKVWNEPTRPQWSAPGTIKLGSAHAPSLRTDTVAHLAAYQCVNYWSGLI